MLWGKMPQITYSQMQDSYLHGLRVKMAVPALYCCEAAEGHRRPTAQSVTNPFSKAEEEQRKAQEEMERPRLEDFGSKVRQEDLRYRTAPKLYIIYYNYHIVSYSLNMSQPFLNWCFCALHLYG